MKVYVMRTVIIVSYRFPPCGGKAVQRASKLVRYLPDHGWRPVVLTMPVSDSREAIDESLLAELPSDLTVLRPSFHDWWRLVPHDIRKRIHHPLPDRFITWAHAMERPLIDAIRHLNADALITTSPTHSVHMLGLAAKKATGIPWVVDFRDQWSGHPDAAVKTTAGRIRDLETSVLTAADAVVGVVPLILRDAADRVHPERLHLIENGYDEEDFSLVDSTSTPHHELRIGYNGTLSAFHDPAPFLAVLDDLAREGLASCETLTVTFTTDAAGIKRIAPFMHLVEAGIVRIQNYLPHRESLRELGCMDVSLLLLTKGRDLYSAKVFEYLYLGNPILSLSPRGDDLERLLVETGGGIVADHTDRTAIREALLTLMERHRTGGLLRTDPNRPAIARFSRRSIAGRYAALLDQIRTT